MADSAVSSASERAIREASASPTSAAIAPHATASTPLLPPPSSADMVSVPTLLSGVGTATRAALVLAAVCGASVLAADSAVCPDGTTAAPSTPPVTTTPPVGPPSVEPRELLLDLYTRGSLLDTVQRAGVFNDSKHFVDMPIKSNSTATTILTEFRTVVQPAIQADPAAINQTLRAFLSKHFDEPGSEIQKTVPTDFTESPAPPRIAAIQNAKYKQWALALHALWKELGRSPSRTVSSSYLQPKPLASLGDTSTSTLIVVPGGRFRESYYWDSYWIVDGLMVSNMQATARRVVQNLLEYVGEFGFVPNGGRLYYLTRSQPPLLSDMVRLVATKTTKDPGQGQGGISKPTWDVDYLRAVVPLLEKEYAYWMTHHAIKANTLGVAHTLNLYNSTVGEPRPESYREDVKLAEQFFPNDVPRQKLLYGDLRAAAESGWDFSSRWFTDHATLATIATNQVVPVDLNAIMYRFESNLAEFHKLLGNDAASATFTDAATKRALALEMVFWDEPSASWRDIVNGADGIAKSPVVAVSNYYPLWAGGFRGADASVDLPKRLDRIVQSLKDSGLIQVAGVQTTTLKTTQQWDAPNAWPPLQDILVEGLLKVDTNSSRALAKELVQKWIDTGYAAWTKTGLMFEKYDATLVGGLGAGGEYEPQFGFGWTNGVVLKFLTEYPDLLQ